MDLYFLKICKNNSHLDDAMKTMIERNDKVIYAYDNKIAYQLYSGQVITVYLTTEQKLLEDNLDFIKKKKIDKVQGKSIVSTQLYVALSSALGDDVWE